MDASTPRNKSFTLTLAALILAAACGSPMMPEDDTPEPARIQLGQLGFNFAAMEGDSDPAPVSVPVSNGGTAALTGLHIEVEHLGSGSAWLTATLDRTTAPAMLTVSAGITGLEPGTYDATVHISAPGAANGPVSVSIHLIVEAAPEIALSADELGFSGEAGGEAPAAQSIAITNAGGGTLSGLEADIAYADGQATGWLSATLDDTAAPADAEVSVSLDGLSAGSYDATLSISSPDVHHDPRSVAVSLTVDEVVAPTPPDLTVSETLEVASKALAGQKIALSTVVFINRGQTHAENFENGIYWSTDGELSSDDQLLGRQAILRLPAGGRVEMSGVSVEIPAASPPGIHFLIVAADHLDDVDESDEANNLVMAQVKVVEPTPVRHTLSISVDPLMAGTITRTLDLEAYEPGTSVTLSATANRGYRFGRWSGDASGTEASVTLTVDRDLDVTASFDLLPPSVTATVERDRIDLTWTYEWPCRGNRPGACYISNQEHYEIEESLFPQDITFQPLLTTDPTRATSYTHSIMREPGTYYFRVRAADAGWATPYAMVAVTVAEYTPEAPSGLAASVDYQDVTISWADNSTNEAGFRVEISTSEDFGFLEASLDVAADETSILWTEHFSVFSSDPYFIRVFAVNDAGDSEPSAVVTAVTRNPLGRISLRNNGTKNVVSARFNGVDECAGEDSGCGRAGWSTGFDLEPGVYDYELDVADIGINPPVLFTFRGTIEVIENEIVDLFIEDASIQQLMTKSGESMAWDGRFFDMSGNQHTATVVFDADGTYELLHDGVLQSSGVYLQLDETIGGYTTREFRIGGRLSTLYVQEDYFTSLNGPPNDLEITYRPR